MYENNFSAACPNGGGPIAVFFDLTLPQVPDWFQLSAWISNFGSSNVHLFEDSVAVAEAQQRLAQAAPGPVDMIMTLPSAGPADALINNELSGVTVFFEARNTSGQTQVVSMRVRG